MKTKVINLYSFSELSEEAQRKALKKLWDINVYDDWWTFIFEDAQNIGLKITEFNLDHKEIDGSLYYSVTEIAQNILNQHGEQAETYKLASEFLEKHSKLFEVYSELEADEDSSYDDLSSAEDDLVDLEDEFQNDLLEEYRIMLNDEYDYLTSRESIIETIEANEYEFNEEGGLE